MGKKLRAFKARFSGEEKKTLTRQRVFFVWKKTGIIFLLVIGDIIFQHYPAYIERYYSTGIYPIISIIQRTLTGWLPFSLGDFLYFLAGVWLLYKIFSLFRGKFTWLGFFYSLGKVIYGIIALYLVFNFFWGLNYFREGIGKQMQVIPEKYTTRELEVITTIISQKLNDAKQVLMLDTGKNKSASDKEIFYSAGQAYSNAQNRFNFLQYKQPSIKSSLYGKLGNYLGFLGYYNPFTGEAQVNVTPPAFVLPIITCHEIGHQVRLCKRGRGKFCRVFGCKKFR